MILGEKVYRAVADGDLIIAAHDQISVSTDNGKTWDSRNEFLNGFRPRLVQFNNDTLLILAIDNDYKMKLFYSLDTCRTAKEIINPYCNSNKYNFKNLLLCLPSTIL